jgi:hypothetical protein
MEFKQRDTQGTGCLQRELDPFLDYKIKRSGE